MDLTGLISPVDLKEGYEGKILLVAIFGPKAGKMICLRSGDDWHREILRNTEMEIQNIGLKDLVVMPAGGAWIRFDGQGDITIYGSSDEFGTCDKAIAADLLRTVFPEKTISTR